MTLREKRVLFTRLSAGLILEAFALGFEPALGWVLRVPRCGVGKLADRSLHNDGLALDLILYRDGRYVTATEHYRELGEWWERQHELASWGGRFGDGNHFSVRHRGMR